jgi:hypothetical protein
MAALITGSLLTEHSLILHQARQKVIAEETLVEKGSRGGTFSVGFLPAPLTQPRGNELFPGPTQHFNFNHSHFNQSSFWLVFASRNSCIPCEDHLQQLQ